MSTVQCGATPGVWMLKNAEMRAAEPHKTSYYRVRVPVRRPLLQDEIRDPGIVQRFGWGESVVVLYSVYHND